MSDSNQINLRPSVNKNAEFICVEYPGVVANVHKMLATLGATENIEKVHSDPSKRLDLRFRPEDPTCKPLYADKTTCTSLLLRVCKYKRKKKNGEDSSQENEFMYRQHICGVITSIYKFTSLCDYQYLPLHRNRDTYEMQNMIPSLTLDDFSALHNNHFFSKEVPLFLPPPTFGRMDKPSAYLYKKEHTNYRKGPKEKTSWENRISSRKMRPKNCILVHYEAKAPTECKPKAFDVMKNAAAQTVQASETVKKAFEERPIWSRNALQGTTGVSLHTLQIVLPVHAYHVLTGPWARLWVRFGYDPKLEPSAKSYQLIDFRLRQGMHTPHIPIKAKRGNYKMPQVTSKRPTTKARSDIFVTDPTPASDEASAKDAFIPPDGAYIFEAGKLPAHRNIFYQICDLKLLEIQKLVHSDVATESTKEAGWLHSSTIAEIRNLLTKDIYKTLSVMKSDTPHEPQELGFPAEASKKTKTTGESATEELEGSDSDEDLEESSDSSDEFDESSIDGTKDGIPTEDFAMEMDDPEAAEEEFDAEFFEDDQIMEASIFSEPSVSKQ